MGRVGIQPATGVRGFMRTPFYLYCKLIKLNRAISPGSSIRH